MKFEYIGENNCKSPDLIQLGVIKKGELLNKGDKITVSNDNKRAIIGLEVSGLFRKIEDTPINNKKNKDVEKKDKE